MMRTGKQWKKALAAIQALALAAGCGPEILHTACLVQAEETVGKKNAGWIGLGNGELAGDLLAGGQIDKVYFGSYYQSDASGGIKEPVLWRVLENDGETAYLLSDQVLDAMPYQTPHANAVYWESSSLRSFLNSEEKFLGTAFGSLEQEAIKETEVAYDKSAKADEQMSCTDKITLLSYQEAVNTDYGFERRPVESCGKEWRFIRPMRPRSLEEQKGRRQSGGFVP